MENIPLYDFSPPATFTHGDRIWRATGETLAIRMVLVDATQTANRIASAHGAQAFARQLLGESISASLLLASGLKGPGTVQLRFSLSGDISRVAADATPLGLVRAMIPQEDLSRTGSFEPMLLPQMLTVRKLDREGQCIAEGIVEMESPDISQTVTHYMRQSEQGKAFLRAASRCDTPTGERLHFSGGFLIESFPGLPEAEWKAVETAAQSLDLAAYALPGGGLDLRALFNRFAAIFPAQIHQEFKVESYCPCTEDGVLRAMAGLGRDELLNILMEGQETEVFCEFCRRRYAIHPEQIGSLLDGLEGDEVI